MSPLVYGELKLLNLLISQQFEVTETGGTSTIKPSQEQGERNTTPTESKEGLFSVNVSQKGV
jgi:hypothetical protein